MTHCAENVRASKDRFYFWLVEEVAQIILNQSLGEVMHNQHKRELLSTLKWKFANLTKQRLTTFALQNLRVRLTLTFFCYDWKWLFLFWLKYFFYAYK